VDAPTTQASVVSMQRYKLKRFHIQQKRFNESGPLTLNKWFLMCTLKVLATH
jgi:hypothetical protein